MALSVNLLEEAIGEKSIGKDGVVIVIEDCVETSGAFVFHHFLKRFLSAPSSLIIFLAFAHPFSHYDRILRKMGCNLVVQRDSKRLLFFDMLTLECPAGVGKTGEGGEGVLRALYEKIHKAVEVNSLVESNRNVVLMIDDISLMEVAASGSSNDVLDFLHYCHTFTTQFGCSFVVLTHEDIYSDTDRGTLLLQMEYLADVLVKAEPLATGLAADVHGQLTVLNKGTSSGWGSSRHKMCNFHFRLKESCAEYFCPGSRT